MLGQECCSNPPTLNPNAGAGHVEKVGGLDTYVSGPADSNLAVLLVSDVMGYEAPILRKIADKFAAAGYYAVVPDFFYGDPWDPANPDRPIPVWEKDHEPEKGAEDAKRVIEALKGKGVSSVGAAGFCWGGKVVVELAKPGLTKAVVLLHPANVPVDDIKGVEVPIAILGGELDTVCPPKLVKQYEQVLAAKPEVDSYVKIFPNVAHGWTLRYNEDDPEAVKAAEEAHRDMLAWFDKYLKYTSWPLPAPGRAVVGVSESAKNPKSCMQDVQKTTASFSSGLRQLWTTMESELTRWKMFILAISCVCVVVFVLFCW